jgi:hypothetical protein
MGLFLDAQGTLKGSFGIKDTNLSHFLFIDPGSNLTADRTLTITTGDADRTLTLPLTADQIEAVTYHPTSMSVATGSLVAGGTYEDLADAHANYVQVEESNGADPLRLTVTIGNVTGPINSLIVRCYYAGSSSHHVQIALYNNTSAAYDLLETLVTSSDYAWYVLPILDYEHYVDGSKNVIVRFYHVENGVNTHDLYIDYVAVENGFGSGTGATTDHGSLTGLTDDDHTQYALLANTRGDQSFAGDVNVATTFSVGDQNKFTIDYTAYNITDIVHYGASALRFWTISAESDISFLTVSSERLRLRYDGKVNVIYPGGFGFKDNSGSNYLRLACGTTLGADRTLTFTPGDSNRTLNFTSGATGKVFSSDASGDGSWSYPSADITSITQNSHGFVAGNVLYHTGTVYAKAKADAESTSEAIGVVSASIDTNTFTLVTGGYISGLSGLTAGSVYYLSGATAGAMTATEPTTEGHVSKPILIAVSTTTGFVFNMRGLVVGGEATYHRSFVNADLSTGVLTVTHNLGHTYVQVCVSNNSSKVVIPDDITFSSSNALAIDLTSFGTLTGTWHVSVFDIGGTMTTYDQSLNTTDSPTFSQGNFTTTHTTTALVDHIGQHTASHRVIFDNEALFAPTSCGIDLEPIVVGGATFDFALVSTIDRTTSTYNNMFIGGHSDTASSAGGTLAFGRRRKTTPYTIQSGDRIGAINFYGYDATDFGLAAQIIAEVDGTPGAGDMPGRILFSTSPDGTEAPTERMRISSTGEVYTVVWQAFSPTMTGMDDYTGGGWSNFSYMKIGRLVWMTWDFYGHHNAGSASLAFALPYTAAAGCWWNPCSIADNAVWLATPGQSIVHSGISTTTCIFGKTTSAASYNDFTATGGAWKGSRGQMWYYATS